MNFLKRLSEMHAANKAALTKNYDVLEAAERDAETIKVIQSQAEEQARKLHETNFKNHYSESLTHAFRGKPA
jgi:hypothetical protein